MVTSPSPTTLGSTKSKTLSPLRKVTIHLSSGSSPSKSYYRGFSAISLPQLAFVVLSSDRLLGYDTYLLQE